MKIIQFVLSFLCFSFLCNISSIGALSTDKGRPMQPTTIVEDFYSIDFWNEDLLTSILQNRDKITNFTKINMPVDTVDPNKVDPDVLNDNEMRYTFENVSYFPWIVANGIALKNIDNTDKNISNIILDGIKNNKQYASFYINQISESEIDLIINVENSILGEYQNLNINMILLEDWVNCDFRFGKWIFERKTTRRYIPREYPLTAYGKEVEFQQKNTITERLKLYTNKSVLNKCYFVAFIQDPLTKEMLASAILPYSKIEPAYFNWNDWSECIFSSSLGEMPNQEELCHMRKTGLSEMTSQNHGFAVDEDNLPSNVRATHKSLFDDSLQGVRRTDKPAFSFQGHPEASPGPHDVAPLFDRFIADMKAAKA